MDSGLGASTGDLRSYDQSLLKQCRSASELDDHTTMDGTDNNNNNSRKLSRTDSYLSCRQQQQQPTSNDSSSPDENPITTQLGSNDQHLMMSSSPGGYLNQVSAAAMRQLPYLQQHQQLYPYKQTQGHFGGMGQQFYPFTASQWAELEHQALIFKYMMARVPVPPELLNPIRRSVAAAIGPHNLIPSGNIGGSWGGFQQGVSGSPLDAEPGRCRRTDGKKWRCSRPVVPEQKYCERHMHRGRHRSRKAQEAAAGAGAAQSGNGVLKSSASNSTFQSSIKGLGTNNSNGGGVSIGGKMFATSSMPHGMAVSMEASGGGMNSHSQLPLALSASQSNKDQRFLNAMSKAHFDLRPEQLLFSEVSGSTRELAPMQAHHPSGNCNKLQSSAGTRMRMIPTTTTTTATTGNSSMMQQHFGDHQAIQQQQYKSMMGTYDDSGKSMQQLGMFAPEQQQQQQQLSPLIRGVERKPEALRHFFDDWPRAPKDHQLSWSDTDDSYAKLNSLSASQLLGLRNCSESPTTAAKGAMFSPLKLSLEDTTTTNSTADNEEDGGDPYTSIGLTSVRPPPPSWFANNCSSLDNNVGGGGGGGGGGGSNAIAGGPLAAALQNPMNAKPAIGFNLLGSERRSHQQHQNVVASPTGVLQKMACFSDCSSSASSPGSVKTEANNPQ